MGRFTHRLLAALLAAAVLNGCHLLVQTSYNREIAEQGKARTLAQFLWWVVHDGQSYSPFQHFATLPPEIVVHAEEQIRSLRSRGQPLVTAQQQ